MDEPRRAAAFDAHLAGALAGAAATGDCPEADVLAAWLDGSLDPATRDTCQAHLATCARCQAVLAAAVRAEDVPSAVPASDMDAAAAVPPSVATDLAALASTHEIRETARAAGAALPFRRRRLAWAAPIALAATVMLAVWVARSARENATASLPAQTTVAPAQRAEGDRQLARQAQNEEMASPAAPPAPVVPVEPGRTATKRAPEDQLTSAPPGAAREQPRAAPPSVAKRETPSSALPPPIQAEPPTGVLSEARPVDARPAPAREPPAPSPAQQKSAETRDVAARDADRAATRETSPEGAPRAGMARAPVAGPVAAAPMTSTRTVGVSPSKSEPRMVRAASPSAAVEWQLIDGTRLVRTTRDGAPPVGFVTTDDLRALAAWSDTVAWAVGAGGAVWRTVDGRTWTRTTPPADAMLVALVLQGPDRATVTAADGRRFTTDDGGNSWRLAPGR